MSELGRGTSTTSPEGWRADPFGRHEVRFFDGIRWTPYVRDGDAHSIDEPIEGVTRGPHGPPILTAGLLVVELHSEGQDRTKPYSVYGRDGRDLGTVRRSVGAKGLLEVIGGDGLVVLTFSKGSSARKTVVTVRNAHGAVMGRLLEQHLPGMTTFALESAAGSNVGFVRARTWAGWDIRVEDERNRPVARVSNRWDGLDRDAFPIADGYVVHVDRETSDPQRSLVLAAVLSVDALLKKDTRGFQ